MPDREITPGFVLSRHAGWEIARRGLDLGLVQEVLRAAEQVVTIRPGRVVFQSRHFLGLPPKQYLVRVVVDIDREPAVVVTAYRTSRIAKYWSGGS